MPGETQATFTGAQQRGGVALLAFVVIGLFGRREPHVPSVPDASSMAVASSYRGGDAAPTCAAAGVDGGDEEGLHKGFQFDWGSYHDAFGDKPLDVAVTEMFAEYATLYGRLSSRVGDSVPPPMTLSEAISISEQAKNFVLNYVTPLLGPTFSMKFHKLLRHLLDAIRYHGNLRNGNTSSNESEHKVDKAFYNRTNRHFGTFTEQIVRRSQGSRELLATNAAADGGGAMAPAPRPSDYQPPPPSTHGGADQTEVRASDERVAAAVASGAGARTLASVETAKVAAVDGVGRTTGAGKTRLSVATLCARPGLSSASKMLRLPEAVFVPVLSRANITARFECGAQRTQVVRASPSFNGSPWYDAVLYEMEEGDEELCIGEVRALVRLADGDYALVRDWEPAEEDAGCPLVERGCLRLKWCLTDDEGAVAVRRVPLERIKRLGLVVPDFGDLKARRGVTAVPPALHAPHHEHRESRFFLNTFFPWG